MLVVPEQSCNDAFAQVFVDPKPSVTRQFENVIPAHSSCGILAAQQFNSMVAGLVLVLFHSGRRT
jgi:hypothetical protein